MQAATEAQLSAPYPFRLSIAFTPPEKLHTFIKRPAASDPPVTACAGRVRGEVSDKVTCGLMDVFLKM